MDKQSGTKFILILALVGAAKLTYTIVKRLIIVLSRTIVYFGLYVPFAYMIVGSVLVGLGFFRFEVIDINSIMFYIGISLCLVCSVIITVKSKVKSPVSSIAEGFGREINQVRQQNAARIQEKRKETPREDPILFVYHSSEHPELLIEEHKDRYVVYYDDGESELQFLRVEPKTLR